ncbi:MAG: nicotinate (nicotinamide) nucleotide adenylyltransferase [Anaerolineales bacterium]|nr:nicotinate (nicotinamide) nucleotide adenylyltransferase [Anaerolineales bacterium]
MKKPRVGYFGGTFDPPHLGHIILAAEAKYYLGLDEFRWVITPEPPHKKGRSITPVKYRLDMLKLVVADQMMFEISEVDIQRIPPHYAADTVEILKNQQPSEELVYIIGEDSLKDLPDWYETSRFISAIDQLAVAPRPEVSADLDQLERMLPGLSDKIIFIPDVLIDISSSMIRERVREGAPFEHFLIDSVAEYIKMNQLYLTGNDLGSS